MRSSIRKAFDTALSLRAPSRKGLLCAVFTAVVMVFAATPASAQDWNWPWDGQQQKPVPKEPVFQPQQPNNPSQWVPPPGPPPSPSPAGRPPQGLPPGAAAQQAPAPWSAKSNICVQLEQRLVQEGQRGSQSRDLVPMVEAEIRQVEQQARTAQQQLDRSNCYEYFLFTKSLISSKKCRDLAGAAEQSKRRLADLDVQRQQLQASQGRSYADDIVGELARNNCPGNYAAQSTRRDSGDNIWQEESGGAGGGLGSYNSVPYATYRTLCVRQCDGYYFPISFSTLPNHFERDDELCQSKCAAPVDLYYYQNPGSAVDQMIGFRTNAPYSTLKTAFRYRKEFVAGCSCKQTEFMPDVTAAQQTGAAAPAATRATSGSATSGWSADSIGADAQPAPAPPARF